MSKLMLVHVSLNQFIMFKKVQILCLKEQLHNVLIPLKREIMLVYFSLNQFVIIEIVSSIHLCRLK